MIPFNEFHEDSYKVHVTKYKTICDQLQCVQYETSYTVLVPNSTAHVAKQVIMSYMY